MLHGSLITAVPRLLALLCILSVFIPAFIMADPLRSLFMPLTLGVGFAMISSYLLSSTFVPIMCVSLLKHMGHHDEERRAVRPVPQGLSQGRGLVRPPALDAWSRSISSACGLVLWLLGMQVGTELFPQIDSGQFVLRFRPPPGSNFELTRQMAVKCLEEIEREAKPENIAISMGFVGQVAPNFGIDNMVLFMRGPDDGQLRVALREDSGIKLAEFRERLRKVLPERVIPWLAERLEQGDLSKDGGAAASQAGDLRLRAGRHRDQRHELRLARRRSRSASSAPISKLVRQHADKIAAEMRQIPFLRDVRFQQELDYPSVEVEIDREKAGLSRATVEDVAHALVMATASTRFTNLNYWIDVKTGFDYLVQIQVPPLRMDKPEDIETLPLESVNPLVNLMVRDVATVRNGRAARRAGPRHVAALHDADRERRGRGHGPGLAPGRPGDRSRRRRRPAACGSSPWASSRR